MKKYKTYMLMVITASLLVSFALISTADTHNVTNPGSGNDIRQNFQNAISAASPGDTVQLPSGSFRLDGTVTVGKSIHIKGAGQDQTVLYRDDSVSDATLEGWQKMIDVYNVPLLNDYGPVISDIHFKSKTPSVNRFYGGSGSSASDIGVKIYLSTNFVISDCKFENFGFAGVYVKHYDYTSKGLIRNNNFIHNIKMCSSVTRISGTTLGYGVVVYGQNGAWRGSSGIGTDNMIYIEDNYFFEHRHAVAAGAGAAYCFRYNEVEDNLWGQAVDAHGGGNYGNDYSARAYDIYENSLLNYYDQFGIPLDEFPSSAPDEWSDYTDFLVPTYTFPNSYPAARLSYNGIAIRGGEGVICDNTIGGFRNDISIKTEVSGTYPILYQIGWLSGYNLGVNHSGTAWSERQGDLFIDDNIYNQVYMASYNGNNGYYSSLLNYDSILLVEDRDFHLDKLPYAYSHYTYPHPRNID
jgi:hypothetical protein